MATFFFILTCGVCLVQMGWSLRRPNGVIEFPFLIATVYLGWFMPQAYRVSQMAFLPDSAVNSLMTATFICAVSGFAGYLYGDRQSPVHIPQLDYNVLTKCSVVMAFSGAYFYWKLTQMPEEMLAQSKWSGDTVKYLFLSQLLTLAFYIAIGIYLKTKNKLALVPIALGFLLFVVRIIVAGRRSHGIELGLAIFSLFWFLKGWRPPKALIVASIPVVIIFVNGVGIYRRTVLTDTRSRFATQDVSALAERVIQGLSEIAKRTDELLIPADAEYGEVHNAVLATHSSDKGGKLNFGLSHWNQIVFRFVPAQVFGRKFKKSLMFDLGKAIDPSLGHNAVSGTTSTGIADAYASFGFFGGINFFIIGFICRRLWERSTNGDFIAQLLNAKMLPAALIALTHSTDHFVTTGILCLIFCAPAFYLCLSNNVATHARSRLAHS